MAASKNEAISVFISRLRIPQRRKEEYTAPPSAWQLKQLFLLVKNLFFTEVSKFRFRNQTALELEFLQRDF